MAIGAFTRGWRVIRDVVLDPGPTGDPPAEDTTGPPPDAAPVVWMLGKVQAGKSSIVRAVTGDADAAIGSGFRPCTRTARAYDFPADAPVLRFLDTRGLGEVDYDPGDDLALLEGKTHVVLAVARALDPQQDAVLDALATVRRRHPDRPIVVALTCLHEGFPEGGDQPPYAALRTTTGYGDLDRALRHHETAFTALPGDGPVRCVPVDLTRPAEGWADPDYGLDALLDALAEAAPLGMETLLDGLRRPGADHRSRRAHAHIMGYAAAAAALDAVPVVGLVAIPTIQGKLLHSLAGLHGVAWDRRRLTQFAGALGAGTALNIGAGLGLRQAAKMIPLVGQTVGAVASAATSFSVTYALGKAADRYLDSLGRHREPRDAEIAATYRAALHEALEMARRRGTARHGRDRDAAG